MNKASASLVMVILGLLLCALPAWGSARQDRVSAEICKLESDTDNAAMVHDEKFLAALFAESAHELPWRRDRQESRIFASPRFVLKKAEIEGCRVHVYGGDVAVATGLNNWAEASSVDGTASQLYMSTARDDGRLWQDTRA